MQRTTMTIPPELRARLRKLAADRGVSMATIIREAIDEKLAASPPAPRSLGIGASGKRNIARRSGEDRAQPRQWR
jgi:hypothetical protein